ncbi:MAG: helix-turn-helix domain-containing protein [Candidatus Acidiferrales bacterium]
MPRQTQFAARKNPAPHSRRYGLCLAVNPSSLKSERLSRNSQEDKSSSPTSSSVERLDVLPTATTAEDERQKSQLLTVQDVVEFLHVPVSWVYQRTRKRGTGQLPHLKLGKYLRFEESTVTEFIREQRRT